MDRIVGVVQSLTLYALLLVLAVMSLVWNGMALLLHPFLNEQRGRAVGRAGIAYGYRLFWSIAQATGIIRVDASVLAPFNQDRSGVIIAANHPSLLDAVLLASRLPRGVCIMKASLMRNVFLGAGARLARYIGNDHPVSMVRSAVAELRGGGQLILFPEGTRTTQRPINAFRPGITLIAKLAEVPIQTVFIDTDSPYLSKGWPLWSKPPIPIEFSVRLGERFAPEPNERALLLRLERYFAEGVHAPQPAAI